VRRVLRRGSAESTGFFAVKASKKTARCSGLTYHSLPLVGMVVS
jgi:hypothetical protein